MDDQAGDGIFDIDSIGNLIMLAGVMVIFSLAAHSILTRF